MKGSKMNRWRKKRKLNSIIPMGDGGFTLLEVIIAMAILALVSMPLLNYFLDSLKQSALMAKRQKATLTAQELTESMKSAEYLIKENVDPNTNNVTYTLENLPSDLTGVSIDDTHFNHSGPNAGRGVFTVAGTKDRFDVEITVSTNSPSNDKERALVQGIDATTDVILLEGSQQMEAMIYFTSVNVEYCAQNPLQVPLTQDEIENNMTRIIYVDVIKNASDYTVQAYYDYSCGGLKGAGSAPISFRSTYLENVKIASLSSIYLLYNCLEDSPGSFKEDTVEMSIPSSSADPDLKLGIYLAAQNLPASASAYTIQINGCSTSDTRLKFHSNYRTADHLKVGTGEVTDKQLLTDKGKPLRVLMIKTEVYEVGHAAGDKPLASMSSTKGE